MTCRHRDQDAPPLPPASLRHHLRPSSRPATATFERINFDPLISPPELERSDPPLHSPSLRVCLREPLSHSFCCYRTAMLFDALSSVSSCAPSLLFSLCLSSLCVSLSCLLLALRNLCELLQPHCADVLPSANVLISQRSLFVSFIFSVPESSLYGVPYD